MKKLFLTLITFFCTLNLSANDSNKELLKIKNDNNIIIIKEVDNLVQNLLIYSPDIKIEKVYRAENPAGINIITSSINTKKEASFTPKTNELINKLTVKPFNNNRTKLFLEFKSGKEVFSSWNLSNDRLTVRVSDLSTPSNTARASLEAIRLQAPKTNYKNKVYAANLVKFKNDNSPQKDFQYDSKDSNEQNKEIIYESENIIHHPVTANEPIKFEGAIIRNKKPNDKTVLAREELFSLKNQETQEKLKSVTLPNNNFADLEATENPDFKYIEKEKIIAAKTPSNNFENLNKEELPTYGYNPKVNSRELTLNTIRFDNENRNIVLDLNTNTNFKLVKSNDRIYNLMIPKARLNSNINPLAMYPPMNFEGINYILPKIEKGGVNIVIGIEPDTRVNVKRIDNLIIIY